MILSHYPLLPIKIAENFNELAFQTLGNTIS